MLKEFIPRLYQETIFDTCTKKNTLVVLPTGMGKTGVALMLSAHRLKLFPQSKVLVLAPTKPLVQQHFETFKRHLDFPNEKFVLFTGNVSPEKRAEMWKNSQIIMSTPQGLENDSLSSKIYLKDVSLLVFDESHRAVGDYSYVFIAKQYVKQADFPKILALTASPGDDLEKITEICKNLHIEEVEIRTEDDPDVVPYVQEMNTKFVKVDFPVELKDVRKFLSNCYKSKLEEIQKYGYLSSISINKTELIHLQGQLFGQMSNGDHSIELMKSISLLAEALKIEHGLALLETQGIQQLKQYLEKLDNEALISKTKAVKNLVRDLNFRSALIKSKAIAETGLVHPKLLRAVECVKEELGKNQKSKIILFTQFRDTAVLMKNSFEKENILSEIFVGQTKKKKTGLSQKEQIAIIGQFRDGFFNVLISTSVGEEGLDIPAVDLVVFYEPVPSAIRYIQRRGRTGRQEKGRAVVLITKGTRDEAYQWSADHKEKRMKTILQNMKTKINLGNIKQTSISQYSSLSSVRIIADYREKGSGVLKALVDMNVKIELEQLREADYVLSSRVGVEFKTVDDFVNSIIDGRLLEQVKYLRRQFERPVILIEGEQDLYSVRKIHPNAIRGMLATIIVSFGIPIIQTKNFKETAELIYLIAKKEQEKDGDLFHLHSEKRLSSLKEQQEYIASSFPNIGPYLGKALLKNFKTIKNIANASEEDLKKVEGIGEKLAKGIKDVSEKEWNEL